MKKCDYCEVANNRIYYSLEDKNFLLCEKHLIWKRDELHEDLGKLWRWDNDKTPENNAYYEQFGKAMMDVIQDAINEPNNGEDKIVEIRI